MVDANWDDVDELRQIFIEGYTESKLSTVLEKACNEEYELMRDYNGRQILELLQNVDDACCESTGGESEVYIKYVDNILEVGNTGTTFSKETIERLCLGHDSNKPLTNIGNKGTGFRSLLNDAEWIEIHSGEFSVRFSYEYTNNLFKKYISKDDECYCELIAEQFHNWKKDYPLCFPVLNCPEAIEKKESDFDTLIRLKVKDDNASKITGIDKQLNMPFYKSILFLPHITRIVIETNESKRIYEKCVVSKGDYDDVLILDNTDRVEQYYLFKKHTEISKDKFADLIIAYSVDNDFDWVKEKLYCYFPIRSFQTPIHALIHAPFITNNSRDDVSNDNDQINHTIFVATLEFIKEVADKLKDLKDTNPIEFVTPVDLAAGKIWDSEFFNLKDFYLDLLCDSKIIPTVNGTYISINDGPKLLGKDFPDEFKGEGFEHLVKDNLDEAVRTFIISMCKKKSIQYSFDVKELSDAINLHSSVYPLVSAIKVFVWWSRNYRTSNILPKLIKDTNDNWVQRDVKAFLPTSDDISMLDSSLSWVNLCVIKQEYVTELVTVIKEDDKDEWEKIEKKYSADRTNEKRLLDSYSDLHLAIGFTEQSSSRVIISEITNQVDSEDKALSFICWFFENYKDKMAADSELSKLRYKLPDNKGILRDTKSLYFGAEYGNDLASKVFDSKTFYPICEIKKLYNGEEKEGFLEFIKLSGVLSYPQCRKIAINEIDKRNEFVSHIKKKYQFGMNINYLETYSIDNLHDLLLRLSTEEIVTLLTMDLSLSSLILSTEKQSTVKQQSNWAASYFNSNEYVMFILNTTKWIEINGVKYAPRDIIKYDKLINKIDSIYGIKEKDLISLLSEDIVKRYNLEFKDDFSDFSDKEILEILLKLPEVDTGEISRRLYTDILKGKKDTKPEYTLVDIKLLAKDGKFQNNSELIYVDKSIPQKIENSRRIDIPIQKSTETIKNWFGVEKVELNYKMSSCSPIDNFEAFAEEIKDLKVCILSILEDTTTNYITKLQRMKVIPCYDISAIDCDSNCTVEMADFSFIRKDGCFYYKLLNNDLQLIRGSHEYAMGFIEMFREAVSSQIPMDLAELLISKNHDERRLKIEEKYGIDKWSTSYESLFEKSNLSQMIEDYFKCNGLGKELTDKVGNIDFSSNLFEDDFELLFECLKEISKDICDLNNIHSTIRIDGRNYIKKQGQNSLRIYKDIYRSNCYEYLKSKPEKQSEFLDMVNSFEKYDFADAEIDNSVYFSPVNILKEKFNLFSDKQQDVINVDDLYNENYTRCIATDGIEQVDFDYYIEANVGKRSLLYFDSYERVVQDFMASKKENSVSASTSQSSSKLNNINTSTVVTTLIPDKSHANSHHNGEFGERKSNEINEKNEKAGREAENIAYIELKKKYPNLIWNSKYSIIPADKNKQPLDGIVCDMWNKSAEGDIFFEVKSSVTEFEMSINEYESMKKNPHSYYVVLVNRDTKEISLHLFHELDELKTASKYKFFFKQQKQVQVEKNDV